MRVLQSPSNIARNTLPIAQFQFNVTNMKRATRQYQMTTRALSAADTTHRILVSTAEEFWNSPTPDLRLQKIASKAEVTVQTILRQFGTKENLLLQATQFERDRIQAMRNPKDVHSVDSAVHQLVTHYEAMGNRVLRMLAEEIHLPALSEIVGIGKKQHQMWCRVVFAKTLASLPSARRKIRLAQLVAICDVYTWKVLRRDCALSSKSTELALIEMLKPLVKDN